MKKRYHITILGYHKNSDTTQQTTIECDYMTYSRAGVYEFCKVIDFIHTPIAYYPIRNTIITKVENI